MGLASLLWLTPLAWTARRSNPRTGFLVGLTLFGFAAAYRLPPVDNLLRILPVLKVTDNRRLTLWVAFGLTLLGGLGLDQVGSFRPALSRWWQAWGIAWVVGAVGLLLGASAIPRFAATIQSRAQTHYARAARLTPGADPAEYQVRANRQADATIRFVPRYLSGVALKLLFLAGLLAGRRAGWLGANPTRAALLILTLVEVGPLGIPPQSSDPPGPRPSDDGADRRVTAAGGP